MAQRKLGRPADQRKALLRNQVTYFLWYGKLETTLERAKEIKVRHESSSIETEDNPKPCALKDNVKKFAERLMQLDAYKKAVNDGKIKEPFIWTGTKVDLARWLSLLVPQLPSGSCDWSHVDNIFTINGKNITSKSLAKALSKTDRKQLDW